MTERFEMVPFEDHQIMTIQNDDGVFVVMKPIVEALGIPWHPQRERIQRHPVMCKGARIIRVPSPGGMQDALALSLEQFHGWLVTLNPLNVKDEERRAVIVLYQTRAFRVLFEHFHGAIGKPRGTEQLEHSERTARRRELPGLMDRLERKTNPEVRRVLHALIVRACEMEGIDPPAIEAIGSELPAPPDILAPFWQAIAELRGAGIDYDHSRQPDRIALSLKEVAAHFSKAGIKLRIDRELRSALRLSEAPRFVAAKPVNSIRGKTINCWVFDAPREASTT